MIIEISATIFGLIQGILVMLNKRSNWLFYIIQMLLLVIFSFINHLYGDVVNNCIYVLIGVVGFITWKNKESSNITVASMKEKIIYMLIIIIGTTMLSIILKRTNDPLPILDSFTTITSFIATFYMIKKKIDAWIIWFINDLSYAIEYFLLPNQAFYLFALNIIWSFMAIGSYITWNKIMKGEYKYD